MLSPETQVTLINFHTSTPGLKLPPNPPPWVQFIHSKQSQAKVLAALSGDSPREPKKQPTNPLVFGGDLEEDPIFLPPYDSPGSLPPTPELETPPLAVLPPSQPPISPSLLAWRTLPHKDQQPDCALSQAQALSRLQSTGPHPPVPRGSPLGDPTRGP